MSRLRGKEFGEREKIKNEPRPDFSITGYLRMSFSNASVI